MTDVWSRIERLLPRVERPSRYVDGEWNARRDEHAAYRVALVYPDTYELGMANQGLAILYEVLNGLDGVAAERAYVPWKDLAQAMREAGVPLFTLESRTPLGECDLVGVTLPYELTYTNVLEALDLAGIPLRAADRRPGDPLVVGGGPCVYNPEPMSAFFDAIVIGEGEEVAPEMVSAHRAALSRGASRDETLRELSRIPGVYVPSLYRERRLEDGRFAAVEPTGPAQDVVVRRVVRDLDATAGPTCPVVPYMDVVHDRVAIEVQRGCTRGCRFCQAGMVYRPVRERSPDSVVRDAMAALACTGYEEVSLTSLSTTDHSRIAEILRRLRRRLEGSAISISLPSLRVDAFSVDLARSLAGARRSGLTLAPEAGTQRLRDVVNKRVSEEDLLATVESAFGAGWRRVKLYFMIGLPTENDADVSGIGELVGRVLDAARGATPEKERGGVRVSVSVTTFVPKAHTPFQWEPQIPREEAVRRQELLVASMPRKGVDLSWHDPEVSFLEAVLARGGRELSDAIEAAWRAGARFDAWTEEFRPGVWADAFASCGVDTVGVCCRAREPGEPLPWAHVTSGVTEEFLARERARALARESTPDCSTEECSSCGVCDGLGVSVTLAGARRGGEG